MDVLLELLKLSIVGLVAGLFSLYLSGRGHREKRWWEMKFQAYQTAIEALSDLCYYYDRHLMAEVEYRQLSDTQKEELRSFWAEAYPKVRKAADCGFLLFSAEANESLRYFVSEQEKSHYSYFEHLDSCYAAARNCLTALVLHSRKDLELQRRWL